MSKYQFSSPSTTHLQHWSLVRSAFRELKSQDLSAVAGDDPDYEDGLLPGDVIVHWRVWDPVTHGVGGGGGPPKDPTSSE